VGKRTFLSTLTNFTDTFRIWVFNRHVKGQWGDSILNDITEINLLIKNALDNNDIPRTSFLIYSLLKESGRIDAFSKIFVIRTIGQNLENFSQNPFVINEGLITIFAAQQNFIEKWEKKYQTTFNKVTEKIRFPFETAKSVDDIFKDPLFQGAKFCILVFYEICIRISEKSDENLIKVSNFLHFCAAGDNSIIYDWKFGEIILNMVIQIGARAYDKKIEPTLEKMIQIIEFSDKEITIRTFNRALDYDDFDFYKYGNMKLFLATRQQISEFKKYYESRKSEI